MTTLTVTIIVAIGLSATDALANPSKPLPPTANGHAYRHGWVPRRGQQAQPTSAARTHNVSYGGGVSGVGVTTGPPKVYVVFWGSQWGSQGTNAQGDVTLSGDPDGEAPYLQEFIKGLGTGGETWSGVMTQYCQGVAKGATTCPSSNSQHVAYPTGGALAGVWVDESSAAPAAASAHQIGAEAVAAAQHFGDTNSSVNRSAQYVIVSPTGTNPDGWESGGFCAWHDYTGDSTLDGGGALSTPWGSSIAFTNLPYQTDAGTACGENFVNSGSAGVLDGVSIVEGHEYAETITDQFPTGGWTDTTGNEVGDKCAWISSGQGAAQDITLSTGTFAVQSTWANDFNNGAGGCEVSHPIVTDPATTVTVTNPGNQTSTVGQAASLQVVASDSDSSQTLSYSATGLPAGLTINSATGLISGAPSAAVSTSVTVTATDLTSSSGSATFTWTVGKRATSASVSCAPTTVAVGAATTCTATVSDSAAGTASTPTGTVNFAPSGSCTLAATGTTGVAGCQATYTPSATGSPTITAAYQGDTTHANSTSGAFQLHVVGSNAVSVTNPGARSTPAGQPVSLQITASDSGGAPLSYSVSGLPSGLSINPSTGLITGTPTTAGGASVTVTATDSTTARGTTTFEWTVTAPSMALCPAPTGRLRGITLGLVRLGMTGAQARAAYAHSSRRSSATEDVFCLTPTGINVGYPSARLLGKLTSKQRTSLRGRVIWVTTANRHYSVDGIAVGAKLAAAKRAIKHGTLVSARGSEWYLASDGSATVLLKIRGGVVRELGLANAALTRSAKTRLILVAALA